VGENATVGCQVNVWIMAEGCREREFRAENRRLMLIKTREIEIKNQSKG